MNKNTTKPAAKKAASKKPQLIQTEIPQGGVVDILNEIDLNDTDPTAPPAVTGEGELVNLAPIEIQDVQNVFNSHRYTKGKTEYASPSALLQPCIDVLINTGGRLTLEGSHDVTITDNTTGEAKTAFGRVNLVCSYAIDSETTYEIGIMAAFDLQQPRIKIYRGAKVRACLNLCIFSADDVVKFDINEGVNTEILQNFVRSVSSRIEETINIINRLKAVPVSKAQVSQIIGSMLMTTITQKKVSGITTITAAAELLANPKSKYFFEQKDFNAWLMFNAFTEYFAPKVNFFDIPEKARDVYGMILESRELFGE